MSANDKASATYGPGRTTPPLEARIAAVLAEHMDGKRTFEGVATDHEHLLTVQCPCGWFEINVPFQKIPLAGVWQAHVAEYTAAMLAPVIAEAQAEAFAEGGRAALSENAPIMFGRAYSPSNPYRKDAR